MRAETARERRALGTSGLSVAPLTLGGNVFGWTVDAPTSFAVLDAFVGEGFNFIDTADVYSRWVPGNSGGESETILGEWFHRSGKRDQVVLATKAGMEMADGKKGLSKSYLISACEASLRRLRTDRIDLYQSHRDDDSVPLEERFAAFQTLIEQGKVRAIGASNYTGARLTQAMEVAMGTGMPAYAVLQPEYNLRARENYEQDLAPVVATYGLGVIPYYPLAAGFLTGKYKSQEEASKSKRGMRVARYFDERGERILQVLAEVAAETGAKMASVALAWLMAQPTITAPIASATSLEQLQDLIAAVGLNLSHEQQRMLTDASAY